MNTLGERERKEFVGITLPEATAIRLMQLFWRGSLVAFGTAKK